MMMSPLYQTNAAHWNNSLSVNMSLHSDTLSRFRTNQSLLLFLNVASLAEKQQISILILWYDPTWTWNPISTALQTSTLIVTPLMRQTDIYLFYLVNFTCITITYLDRNVYCMIVLLYRCLHNCCHQTEDWYRYDSFSVYLIHRLMSNLTNQSTCSTYHPLVIHKIITHILKHRIK
jgi:hypothetical protein